MEIVSVLLVTLFFGGAVGVDPVITLSAKTGSSLTPTEGDTVTLVCSETVASTALQNNIIVVTYFKDGTSIAALANERTIATTPKHEITFNAVKLSDSGQYKFEVLKGQQMLLWDRVESAEIKLQVTAKTTAEAPKAGATGQVAGLPQAVVIAAIIISVLMMV